MNFSDKPAEKDPLPGKDPLPEKDPVIEKSPLQLRQELKAEREEARQADIQRLVSIEAARPPQGYIQVHQPALPTRYAEQVTLSKQKTDVPESTLRAIEMTTARLQHAMARFAEKTEINAILRRAKAKGEKAQVDALREKGLPDELASQLAEEDSDGQQGFPDISTYRHKIRHLKARLSVLLSKAGCTEDTTPKAGLQDSGVKISEDPATGRLEVLLPAEPDPETRKWLTRHGFRPSESTSQLWTAPLTDKARSAITDDTGKRSDA